MLLDLSVNDSYIEDCEVCCNPMEIAYTQEVGVLQSFEVRSIEQ